MIDRIERARQFRKSGVAWATTATDAEASTVPSLYEGMKYDGSLIKAGTRINWHDTVVKAAVDLWDNEENNPDNAPTLWAALPYKDGIRIIPEVISVTEAFSKDEKGWWKDEVYTSKVDNNVYTPEQLPDNWTKEESGV